MDIMTAAVFVFFRPLLFWNMFSAKSDISSNAKLICPPTCSDLRPLTNTWDQAREWAFKEIVKWNGLIIITLAEKKQ